ncbi:MAG: hypothetical protein H6807_13895 [Planctomycetes bacterium]|nr:hypothetical protein [Planctomycetota bacterium]
MIKIHASFTKKVPGEEPYSSDGVHLGVEIEVPDQVLNDPNQFREAVRRLFAQARAEVEEQVAGPRAQPREPDFLQGGRQPEPRRGGRDQPASKKQLDFLLSLGRRSANLSPADILAEAGVSRLSDISKAQASAMIDRLNKRGAA